MEILKRIFGICRTPMPQNQDAWQYADGVVTVDLNRMPELAAPGGAARLEGKGLPERVLLVHGNDGAYHAFRNRCTHMGRRIDPLPDTDRLRCCSVSRSTFDYAGEPLEGPAGNSITAFPVTAAEGRLTVSLR